MIMGNGVVKMQKCVTNEAGYTLWAGAKLLSVVEM